MSVHEQDSANIYQPRPATAAVGYTPRTQTMSPMPHAGSGIYTPSRKKSTVRAHVKQGVIEMLPQLRGGRYMCRMVIERVVYAATARRAGMSPRAPGIKAPRRSSRRHVMAAAGEVRIEMRGAQEFGSNSVLIQKWQPTERAHACHKSSSWSRTGCPVRCYRQA